MKTISPSFLLFPLLSLLAFTGCQSEAAKQAQAEHTERTNKLLAARSEFMRKPANVALVTRPYLKGKTAEVAALNGGEYSFKSIPVFPLAENADDIKTIIQQDCRPIQKGMYRSKEDPHKTLPAMAMTCQITLVDRASSTAYYIKNFETEPDPETVTSATAEKVYKTPDEEIKAFLESLPRQ